MELRQLEYFMITCEKGSFNQAAECLYTTQPNVSKVISSLEKELGRSLFERSSRGIRITPYGEAVREYAQNILHNVSLIDSLSDHNQGKKFSLATYPSNMISRLLTDFYKEMGSSYIVEHSEGTVEEISNRVAQGLSEIGIVYIAQKQLHQFQHILSHKKLKFIPLDVKEACVYVGPHHPRYHDESIDFQELSSLSFVRGVRDFFSVEHHLSHVSLGAISTEQLHYSVYTNSDHLTINLLMNTDVCSLGINFLHDQYKQYDVQQLQINNCEPFLLIGYICPEEGSLSEAAKWFIRNFQAIL
ncbi:LysR family transcriptional regulator [Clostridium sp. AF32-12BH]|uniref:LysR family transcriptional regulator n=1 Tax=Clostridium sp. AF32-12BH TaxID=2292006 RepID=UPI000E4D01EA|nr:LysR family transcriptional regulator [Clostridium sp. AF32-12BH]RHP49590.1 LysR family transcriptional regulator [Clostridium sp. AF32-12BH]